MSTESPKEFIIATEEARTLPSNELLTGRGFITGKSGAGKSNSMSVIAEELLEGNYNLLIVDTDGEYFGLKEKYKLLHVGATDRSDVVVTPDHAEKIADIALKQNLPVILDVSGFHKADDAKALIEGVVSSLFVMENELRKPFLLIVEEMQEYLPQSGGKDDLSKLLLRVAKRGRKRGLGLCGLSQRPSAVDKDFITQCDWMVWHRLTWETDVDVVESILGRDIAGEIPELGDGEAYLMTDWDETVERVQFRRKTTFDAGATPGLEGYERPDLTAIGDDLITDLLGETDGIELSDPSSAAATSDESEPTPSPVDSLPTPQQSSSSSPAGDGERASASPDIAVEDQLNLVVTQLESDPPDTDDPDELKRYLEEERKRNEILEDEIRELKTIIENIQQTNGPTSTESSNGESQETIPSQLFTEGSPDGPAGVIVEAGLLVTYLGLRAANAIKTTSSMILQRSRPAPGQATRSTPHGYPITLDHETNHYPYLARKYAVPISIILVFFVIGAGWVVFGP